MKCSEWTVQNRPNVYIVQTYRKFITNFTNYIEIWSSFRPFASPISTAFLWLLSITKQFFDLATRYSYPRRSTAISKPRLFFVVSAQVLNFRQVSNVTLFKVSFPAKQQWISQRNRWLYIYPFIYIHFF